MTISRDQLRAARILLCLSQEELAEITEVGVATIRRFETGKDIGTEQNDALAKAVKEAGVILLNGNRVSGRVTGEGVALVAPQRLPAETVERMGRRVQPKDKDRPRRSGRPFKPTA